MQTTDATPGIFARLKQHHMYQVAIGYALVAGFLIQLASRALPAFGMAPALPAVIIILLAGFPVALVLAWMLIKPKDPANYTSWQKLHWKLGATLSVAVVIAMVFSGFYGWKLAERHEARMLAEQAAARNTAGPAAPVFNPPADTLVVLPFTNLSGDAKQAYFSNGITEELTDALGQNTGLTVIAWETASKYANGKQTPQQIGKALDVAHVLGGSIEREGESVRVSAELVSTVSGRQLWSAYYDATLKNIFAVQDKITGSIAGALKVKFASMQAAPTLNPQAHELYLKGMSALNLTTATDAQIAQNYFQQALKLDPNYADAWSSLSATWLQLTLMSTLPAKEALPKIRAAAHKALALDPHNVHALLELGNADALERRQSAQAKAEYQQALTIDPSNAIAHVLYATVLPLRQALAQTQEGALLDPDSVLAQFNLAGLYQKLGDWPRMAAAAQAANRLSPRAIGAAFYLAFAYTQMHLGKEAVKAFELVHPAIAEDKQLVDAGRLTYQALRKPELRPRALAAVDALRHRPDLDHVSMADVLQLELALGENNTALEQLPKLCASIPTDCYDLSVSPVWLPLHGDPRFEALVKQYDTVSKPAAAASSR